MRFGTLDDIHERVQVVLVILERLIHGFPDGLETGEMNDGVYLVSSEQEFSGYRIAKIHFHERNILPAGDFLHTLEASHVAVRHVVSDNHIVPCLNKFHGHMAAYESGAAGNQNAFFHTRKLRFFASLRMTAATVPL